MIRDWMQHHPWWSGLAISFAAFVLNGIRRLVGMEKRMPQEQKLELRLHRASMALRKLGRAKRLLARYSAVRSAAPAVPMPVMIKRLWRASSDAGDAISHLSAVLKKIPDLGAAPRILANLDHQIEEAKRVRERCRQQARSSSQTIQSSAGMSAEEIVGVIRKAARLLVEAQNLLVQWKTELASAECRFATTMDPTIARSGGIFRNPLKPETAVEDAQTHTVLALRQSQNDLERTEHCLAILKGVFEQQFAGDLAWVDLKSSVGAVLDELDTCLAEAELPLPDSLATAESPFDPMEAVPSGILQRIYDYLASVEAAAWASTKVFTSAAK